jgi:nitrite reductase/ring-hydroxylating ferredoxin subunit
LEQVSKKVIKQKPVQKITGGGHDMAETEENVVFEHYREVILGERTLLKNQQKCQIQICDPFDDTVFHPTDKMVLFKYNDKLYATGSFCGYCYTDIGQAGVFLGDKIICPTCTTSYDVKDGKVDNGPGMRNIASYML